MSPTTMPDTASAGPSILDQFASAFTPDQVSGPRDRRAELVTEPRYITERRYVASTSRGYVTR